MLTSLCVFSDDLAIHRTRWFASYILLSAYVPIILLYSVWLPLTCMGKIKAADIPENNLPAENPTRASTASVAQEKDDVVVVSPMTGP